MSFDKAEWQYKSAQESYCEKYNKNPESLTEEYYDKEYLNDYCNSIGNEKVLSTEFSWEDYFKLEPVLDDAYKKFRESR